MKNLIQKLFIACLAFIGWGYPVCGVSGDLTSVVPQNIYNNSGQFITYVGNPVANFYGYKGQKIILTAQISVGSCSSSYAYVTLDGASVGYTSLSASGSCAIGTQTIANMATLSYTGQHKVIAWMHNWWYGYNYPGGVVKIMLMP